MIAFEACHPTSNPSVLIAVFLAQRHKSFKLNIFFSIE